MKIGALGVVWSDWKDVDYNRLRWATEVGFTGLGAHLTVPAREVSSNTADTVARTFSDVGLEFLQVWGPYPCIITPDEEIRSAGVEAARDIVRLAAFVGVAGAGVRPTSLNPRGDWWPHRDNHTAETEERFVRSLSEIVETAAPLGVRVILEIHSTTVLDGAERIRRIIERVAPELIRVNLDTVNFISSIERAHNPTPIINEMFDILGPYTDTVHVKDFYLEDRLTFHVAETIVGEGLMDLDTVLRRTEALGSEMYAIVEHLPLSLIPQAYRNLRSRAEALGISLR